MTPVFIFSQPRAGSTLLQRILMGHPEIHSVSEPWILLPMAYMLPNNDGEIMAPYDHRLAQRAIADTIECFPRGIEEYYEYTRDVLLNFYSRLCAGAGMEKRYFLDKTPRYYLILPFIEQLFPDAKFIFLFRNPLAVMASIVNTWGRGHFIPRVSNNVDLYSGPSLLSEGWARIKNKSIRVSYEDLITKPDTIVTEILEYLGLTHEEMDVFPVRGNALKGELGDKTGIDRYYKISAHDLESWKQTYNTRYRKRFARKYLHTIGDDVLSVMGYSMGDILKELEAVKPTKGFGIRDAIDAARVSAYLSIQSGFARKAARKILIPGNLTWKLREGCKND